MKERRIHIIAELEKNLEDTIAFFRSLSPHELHIQAYQAGTFYSLDLRARSNSYG